MGPLAPVHIAHLGDGAGLRVCRYVRKMRPCTFRADGLPDHAHAGCPVRGVRQIAGGYLRERFWLPVPSRRAIRGYRRFPLGRAQRDQGRQSLRLGSRDIRWESLL
jgi:hypothetical protein